MQVQDVLNIGKQNLGDKRGYDVKEIRNRGRGRKRKEGYKGGKGRQGERFGETGRQGSGQPGGWRRPEQRHQSKASREREKKEKKGKAQMVAERTEGLSHLDVFG